MAYRTNFRYFLDRPHVARALTKYKRTVLAKTGAFGRFKVKGSLRRQRRGKKARTVVISGRPLAAPMKGLVRDINTGQPVGRKIAALARRELSRRQREEGAGKPPMRGPTDNLWRGIYFDVYLPTESTRIYVEVFEDQPRLRGVDDVPELLEFGGWEMIAGAYAKYDPHPFVRPQLPAVGQKMADLVRTTPLY